MYSPKIREALIPPIYHAPARREAITPAMRQRILKALAIGVLHKHDAIVLGAPSYGVFGNDTNEMPVSLNAPYRTLSAPAVRRYLRLSIGQRGNRFNARFQWIFSRRR
jgi:hypothetical protein